MYCLTESMYSLSEQLLGIYSSNVARRSAEVKNFGRKGEVYEQLLKGANVDDLPIMMELHNHVMGSIGYNRRYNLHIMSF